MQSLNALWVFQEQFKELVLMSEDSLAVILPGCDFCCTNSGRAGAAAAAGGSRLLAKKYCIQRAGLQTDTCGIIPFGHVHHVQTQGLKWDISGPMRMGGLVSSSNHMVSETVSIETSGDLIWTASVSRPPAL
jgi:hypothetical protein